MEQHRAKSGKSQCWTNDFDLRPLVQARFTTDGIHFDSIEGQNWMNCVFQKRLDELEIEFFDTGVLRTESDKRTGNFDVCASFVPRLCTY